MIVTFKSASTGRISRQFKPNEGSFQKGKYVIFDNSSNPFAAKEKGTFIKNAESIFEQQKSELVELLNALAEAEANKEKNYLLSKKNEILNKEIFQGSKQEADFDRYISDTSGDGLSMLINMLLQTKESLEKVVFATNKKRDTLNTDGVWMRKFNQQFANFLKQSVAEKRGSAIGSGQLMIGTLDEFIDNFIDGVFENIDANQSVDFIKQEFKDKIIKELQATNLPSAWIQNLNYNISSADLKNAISAAKIKTTKKYKSGKTGNKTGRQLIEEWIDKVIPGEIVSGLGAEHRSAAQGMSVGSAKVVGGIRGKTDIMIASVTGEADLDTGAAIAQIEESMKTKGTGNEIILQAIKDLDKYIAAGGVLLAVSAKDYGSTFDFSIAGNQKFTLISKKLATALAKVKVSIDSEALLFELNNIVNGAFLAKDRGEVLDQLGLLIAAWMFDDIEQMFAASGVDGVLHIYYINDHYITLSNLLKKAALEIDKPDAKSMATIEDHFVEDVKGKYYSTYYKSGYNLNERWYGIRKYVQQGSSVEINLNHNFVTELGEALQKLFHP